MTVAPLSAVLEAEGRPATEVVLPISSHPVAVPTVLRRETRWLGDLPPNFRAVPGKPALAWYGRALYPEFVLLRLLERAGWSGVWVKNWRGRAFWTDIDAPRPLPPAQADLFRRIEDGTGNRRGGCWDLVAWRGEETLFVESKQRLRDKISPAQAAWLEQALGCGAPLSAFLIAEYTIDSRT